MFLYRILRRLCRVQLSTVKSQHEQNETRNQLCAEATLRRVLDLRPFKKLGGLWF